MQCQHIDGTTEKAYIKRVDPQATDNCVQKRNLIPEVATNCVNLAIENAMQMLQAIHKYDKKQSNISSTVTTVAISDFTNGYSNDATNFIKCTNTTSLFHNSQIGSNGIDLVEIKPVHSKEMECQNKTDLFFEKQEPSSDMMEIKSKTKQIKGGKKKKNRKNTNSGENKEKPLGNP